MNHNEQHLEMVEQEPVSLHVLNAKLLEALELCRPHMYEHASNTEDCAFDKMCAAIEAARKEMK